ncbi:2-amino-4-hydroxy-6-hydroxymethyldihydropteridine diphosphokinase [Arenimonas sp. GDDSR-1]|uniref:2-amino-4-hydroxy-6- hydroxymethyldihydropteridine diphosphokinase n=1 Tax=Arenimonas sp. GDDSR-1 TaxID=2950125 RepID=UPI002633A9A7|nr:2-amino-4-hydroxy-6-hydroxymethyldihydropteridine diphosphokinase [Arenimonas sp. GDDSR-1]
MTVRAFIGLGGNQGDVPARFRSALEAIAMLPKTRIAAVSGLYSSPAWGGMLQDDYTNAVIEVDTALAPEALLDALLAIEQAHGRDRSAGPRWGPRPLDCDILLYADTVIDGGRLQVPHPRMAERAFVLLPLAEIAPDLCIPGLGALKPLLERISEQPIRRIAEGLPHVHQPC